MELKLGETIVDQNLDFGNSINSDITKYFTFTIQVYKRERIFDVDKI